MKHKVWPESIIGFKIAKGKSSFKKRHLKCWCDLKLRSKSSKSNSSEPISSNVSYASLVLLLAQKIECGINDFNSLYRVFTLKS